MTVKRKSGIGRRIGTLVAASVLGSILAIGSILLSLQVEESIKSRKHELQATGYVYASAVAEYIVDEDREQALTILSSIARVPGILYAAAIDGENKTFASLGSTSILQKDMSQAEESTFSLLNNGALPVAVDIVKGGRTIGRLLIIGDISPLLNDLIGKLVSTLLAAVVASGFAALIAFPLQHRIVQPIVSLISVMRSIKDGRDFSQKVEHKSDDETGVLVDTFNDMISELSYRESALERLAYFDPLTGLANRQYFQGELDKYLSGIAGDANTAALILMDLDDFKQINDTFGHTIGDALLMNVAALLDQEVVAGVRVGRLGGDEFIIIVENVSSESEAQEKFAPFLASLLQPLKILEHEIYTSTSTGMALIPRDGRASVELMRRAELALYSAKKQGHGFVHFFRPNMDEIAKEDTKIAQGLRLAIANNNFETHYQPQVDLNTGNVYGFECLIRWQHPERGLVPPTVFIPVAEKTGLINEIGKWILRDSCIQAQAWIKEGRVPREISVNVSAAQIVRPDFIQEINEVLLESGFPPHLLCLELTESLFIGKSLGKVRRILEELRSVGVLLSLDDFGTGYSSLSYLEKLPFDKLKIDQSFVGNIEHDVPKRKILSGIIALSHSLGMQVVAEGAETGGEVTLLRQLGADFVQGYALSKPVSAHEAIQAAVHITDTFHQNVSRPSVHSPG